MNRADFRVVTRCVILALLAAIPARADDLAARLEKEFAKLTADDPAARDAAVEAIAKEGAAAEAPVKARLEVEKDPEARARLERALQKIGIGVLAARRWTAAWSVAPLEVAASYTALSPDGRFAATAGTDERLVVRDAATGKALREFTDIDVRSGCTLAFTADSKRLLCVPEAPDAGLRSWRMDDGVEEAEVKGEKFPGSLEAFRGAGVTVFLSYSECDDTGSVAWVVEPSGVRHIRDEPEWAAISPDGARIVICAPRRGPGKDGHSKAVTVYEAATGNVLRTESLEFTGEVMRLCAVAPDASAAASLVDGHIHVVPLADGAMEQVFSEGAFALTWAEGGLVTVHARNVVRWWKDGKQVREVSTDPGEMDALVSGGGVIAVVVRNARAISTRVLSATTGETLDRFETVLANSTPGDRELIVTADLHSIVYREGRRFLDLPPDGEQQALGYSCRFGNDRVMFRRGENVVVRGIAGKSAGCVLAPHEARLERLEWCREGIVVRSEHGTVLLDGADGHTIFPLHGYDFEVSGGRCIDLKALGLAGPECRAVSADGTWIAMVSGKEIVYRRCDGTGDTKRFQPEDASDPSKGEVTGSLALAADGSLLAAEVPKTKCVDLWNPATGERIARLGPLKGTLGRIAIAPRDRTVMIAIDGFEGGDLMLFEPDGTPAGHAEWPVYGSAPGLVVQGQWALASRNPDDGSPEILLVDVKSPENSQAIRIPDTTTVSIVAVRESPDGDRLILESSEGAGVLAISCHSGFLRRLTPLDLRDGGVSGFLEGGHPVVLSPDGLSVFFAATMEDVSREAAIKGQSMAVSPDGKRIAIARGSRVTVYDLR